MNDDPKVGDLLENTSAHALARKIQVTEVTKTYFVADVLEGDNTTEPLKVFLHGWHLYTKPAEPFTDRPAHKGYTGTVENHWDRTFRLEREMFNQVRGGKL